jgi:hypothetical protein
LLANKAKNADIAVAMASIFNEVSQQKGKLECSVYLFLVPNAVYQNKMLLDYYMKHCNKILDNII